MFNQDWATDLSRTDLASALLTIAHQERTADYAQDILIEAACRLDSVV